MYGPDCVREDNRRLGRDDHGARRPDHHLPVFYDIANRHRCTDTYLVRGPGSAERDDDDVQGVHHPGRTHPDCGREADSLRGNSAFGPFGDQFSETMANTMCEFMPDRTVREILTGTP